mmetsp:Transcript_808/g.1219  ORF Transcript_808/g.1219 Transcript_808/m.1219 type:complete len:200 (+) Transcript_808:62-661(+)
MIVWLAKLTSGISLAALMGLARAEVFCDPFYGVCEEAPPGEDDQYCDPEIYDCEGTNIAKDRAVRADCDPSIPGDCDCDPSIEQCYILVEGKEDAKIERFYGVVEMVVLCFNIFGQLLALLIPLLFGVEIDDLIIPQNLASFGYLSSIGLFIGYMISTGFIQYDWLDSIVIILIEHVLSNYVPVTILVTVGYSVYSATG